MKNIFIFLILAGTIHLSCLGAMEYPTQRLDHRPEKVQACVNEAFEGVLRMRRWPNNGKPKYFLSGIDDELLLKVIANKPGKANIYIIDLGCANGSWGRNAMEILFNCQIPEKRFHIFSITGGRECDEKVETKGNVTHHILNSFKIENIDEELTRKGFSALIGNIDLIVSSTTFRHFTDPWGTLKKAYALLSPLNGILLADYFNFKLTSTECISIFPETGKEFLAYNGTTGCLFYSNSTKQEFILMRSNNKDNGKLDIQLEYSGDVFTIFKNTRTAIFNIPELIMKEELIKVNEYTSFFNNPESGQLYKYLHDHNLIN